MTALDTAAIIAKLTPPMKMALTDAFDIDLGFITRFESFRSARALHSRGLTNVHWTPASLTPLGLAVRDALRESAKATGK